MRGRRRRKKSHRNDQLPLLSVSRHLFRWCLFLFFILTFTAFKRSKYQHWKQQQQKPPVSVKYRPSCTSSGLMPCGLFRKMKSNRIEMEFQSKSRLFFKVLVNLGHKNIDPWTFLSKVMSRARSVVYFDYLSLRTIAQGFLCIHVIYCCRVHEFSIEIFRDFVIKLIEFHCLFEI